MPGAEKDNRGVKSHRWRGCRRRRRCWSTWPVLNGSISSAEPDISDDPEQRVQFGTSGHRGSSLSRHLHRGPYSGDHASHLRLTGALRHRWPSVHGQRHARAVRASAAHRARSARRQRCAHRHSENDGVTPTPVISRAILCTIAGEASVSPTASSSPRRTILRRMAGSNTIQRTEVRPIRT